jgi:hypothetical protein
MNTPRNIFFLETIRKRDLEIAGFVYHSLAALLPSLNVCRVYVCRVVFQYILAARNP